MRDQVKRLKQAAEQQRRSFAYGNLVLDRPELTREMIEKAFDTEKPGCTEPGVSGCDHLKQCGFCRAALDMAAKARRN